MISLCKKNPKKLKIFKNCIDERVCGVERKVRDGVAINYRKSGKVNGNYHWCALLSQSWLDQSYLNDQSSNVIFEYRAWLEPRNTSR